MTGSLISNAATMLEALAGSLRFAGRSFNRQDQSPPAAVLWPDELRQWESVVPRLRELLPVLTLGPYQPDILIGPAVWLRCVIDGTIVPDGFDRETVQVIYLPGVSRSDLRAVETCPKPLQPLAELQYRGTIWSHRNGRDWTVVGFLQAADGLGVEVAGDQATKDAAGRALQVLLDVPQETIVRAAPLRAGWFNNLLNPDEQLNLLRWMNDPSGFQAGCDPNAWEAFVTICVDRYRFNPEYDSPIEAAGHMGKHDDTNWRLVWGRYTHAPTRYPHLPELLRQARPQRELPMFYQPSSWPQDNEAAEDALQIQLSSMIDDADHALTRSELLKLEREHGARREWVWSDLGLSPLAHAIEHLAILAERSAEPIAGTSVSELADWYTRAGWEVDRAVLDALAAVERTDQVQAVGNAIRAVYRPWLEETSKRYQEAVKSGDGHRPSLPAAESGTCILFSDALRFDLGMALAEQIGARDLHCGVDWTLAALPTVTPTAKPAMSLVSAQLAGGKDLGTVVEASGRSVTAGVLRDLMGAAGFEVLPANETGNPDRPGWTELGAIDSHGHAEGWKVSHRVASELKLLADRISDLLDAGWKKVVVVTDHGWIMLPGGLDKVELQQHLTVHRKGRCARIKPYMKIDFQTVPWHWDADVPIAMAPGVSCFEAGKEYEHGGLSLQECVVPVLTVTAGGDSGGAIAIGTPTWRGLRCNVAIEGSVAGLRVDLRRKAADASSSIANQPQPVRDDGSASLAVIDDDAEGDPVLLVVLDESGSVRAQLPTIVGGV